MRIRDWSSDVCSSDLRRLVIQKCTACGAHQFYPRPFCLACESDKVEWVEASGHGVVYSVTTVRVDRKSVVSGKRVSVRVDIGGRRTITKKQRHSYRE